MDPILERYHALEARVLRYIPTLDTKKFYEAFAFADSFHKGQLRKSGELAWMRPDGKSQVTVIYEDGKPVAVDGEKAGAVEYESEQTVIQYGG